MCLACRTRTVNRFFDTPADGGPNVVFEGPGRDNRAFPPPTFLLPSLIALEEEVNGSGAATFESFWTRISQRLSRRRDWNGNG